MNILLTGISGFLGSNLAKHFINNNFTVTGLVRKTSNLIKLSNIINNENLSLKYVEDDIAKLFKTQKFDVVVHTATNYGAHNEQAAQLAESNELFPLRLLELAVAAEVPFINTHSSLPIFTSPYSLSKANFLNWAQYFCSGSKYKFINITLEHFYGYADGRFVDYLIRGMLKPELELNLTLGEQKRDFIYIKDVLSAYTFILRHLRHFTRYVNLELGSGEVSLIKDLVLLIKQLTGNKVTKLNFGAVAYRENELMESKANIAKLSALGWSPQYNLCDGLNDYIKEYK